MSIPILILCFGVLIGGWSFLSVLGNERQRQVQQRELSKPPATPEDAVKGQVSH